jgi:amino acid transporter
VFWPAAGDDKLLGALAGIALIWLLTFTNILGARESGFVQLITTVLKFVPLAVIGIIGLFFIDGGNYEPPLRRCPRSAPHAVGASSSACCRRQRRWSSGGSTVRPSTRSGSS